MANNKAKKTDEKKPDTRIRDTQTSGYPVRLTCGNGPDEEPDCFQTAVKVFINKGYLETEAKKTTEACLKALAKL